MECSAHGRPSLHLSLHLFTRSAAAALMLFASALTPPLAGRGHDEAGGVIVGAGGTVFITGTTNSFGSSDDAYLLRLEPNGRATDAATWGGPLTDRGDAIDINSAGDVVIGATAEEPPYAFLRAPTRTSRSRTVLAAPDFPLVSVVSGAVAAGGTVEPIAGATSDAPGFDAALLIIRP